MTEQELKLQQLWKKIEDASLPPLSSAPQTSATVIEFGKEDLLPEPVVPDSSPEERAANMEKRRLYCQQQPWWDCTSLNTQGTCRFLNGKCSAAPLPPDQESYYTQWLRVYGPIYAAMEPMDLDLVTGELRAPPLEPNPSRSGRRRSITRRVARAPPMIA